ARVGSGRDDRATTDPNPAPSRSATVPSPEFVVKVHQVQKKRRRVDEAVHTIEDPAVTGNDRTHVFETQVAFDDTDGQVAQLATDADDEAREKKLERSEVRKREPQQPGKGQRHHQRTERPFPCLVGTDLAPEFVPAEK